MIVNFKAGHTKQTNKRTEAIFSIINHTVCVSQAMLFYLSPQVNLNPGVTSILTDTNPHNEISTISISTKEDKPQGGASLSFEKATEDIVGLSTDTASQKPSQNTQKSPHGEISKSHETSSLDFPSTQGLPGITRSEKSECSSQLFPGLPGIRAFSSEASSQSNNVGPDTFKCQSTNENVELKVNSSSSMPDPMNNPKTESPTGNLLPSRPDNELHFVQYALSHSSTQPVIQDQNENKSPSNANEAKKVVSTSQTQSSTADILPSSCNWNTNIPDTSSHTDLVKAHTENSKQQSSVTLQPTNCHTTENTKETTHTLQCTTGQVEKQQNTVGSTLLGPYNNKV